MLLSRDFVGYMANEVVKRLLANKMIEAGKPAALAERIRLKMAEEIGLEDRLNEEVRDTIRQNIVDILLSLLKEEEQIDAQARQKIGSQKKEILEGSEEWDILYRKYYSEEMRKMGIGHQPSATSSR